MTKTISITLGGRAYIVEEQGYQLLDAYLTRLKQHFAEEPTAEELLNDIELSISEKLSEKLNEQKDVITEADIQGVIRVMGQVEEIDGDHPADTLSTAEPSSNGQPVSKRLYRNEDDVVIAGVCSGVAAYLGVDPVFVRIAFVVLAFVNGLGILAYLILWVALPLAKTSAQKLEMRGKPMNLAEMEELVKEKAQTVTSESRAAVTRLKDRHATTAQKILNIPILIVGAVWKALGRFVQSLGPVLAVLISIPFILGSVFGMVATSLLTTTLLFRPFASNLVTDLPLQDLAQGPWYYTGAVSLGFVLLIPLILLLLVGVSLITRKNQFRLVTSMILLCLWIAATSLFAVTAMQLGPTFAQRIDQHIQTQTVTRTYQLTNVRALKLSGNERLTVKRGEVSSLTLRGLTNDLNRIDVASMDGTLNLSQRSRSQEFCLFCLHQPLQGELTLSELQSVSVEDISRANLQGFTSDMNISIKDAGSVEVSGLDQHVTATVRDVGRLQFSGKARSLYLATRDAAKVHAQGLQSESIELSASDISRVELTGNAKGLKADLKDVASLYAHELQTDFVTITTADRAIANVWPLQSLTATARDISGIDYFSTPASTTLRELDRASIRPDAEDVE